MTTIDSSPANLRSVLTHLDPSASVGEGIRSDLIYKGALLTLFLDGSDEAIEVLAEAANRCPVEAIQVLAFDLLARLAQKGSVPAADTLYREYIETGRKDPAHLIEQYSITASQPDVQAVYELLSNRLDRYRELDPSFEKLTGYFDSASLAVRDRILSAAHRSGLDHWALIVTASQSLNEEDYSLIVDSYPTFTSVERELLLRELNAQVDSGDNPVSDAICRLFIRYEDESARDLALRVGVKPRQPVERALFFFLTDQWEEYERLDFNHNLIGTAYSTADPVLRRRILALSRYLGRSDWLENLPDTHRTRWLAEMDDADWQQAVDHLISTHRWEDLWRLALAASPVWSVRLIQEIERSGWVPSDPEDAGFLQTIAPIARFCLAQPLRVKPAKHLKFPSGAVTCLALRSDGRLLAAGSVSAGIQLVQLPEGFPAPAQISGTVPLVRTMLFSQSGDYLAAACGDNQIRIFSIPEHKAIKAISGHTNIIRSLALHPDQRTLFSAGFDGAVLAWRFPQGAEQVRLEQNPLEIHAVGVSPDGSRVLTAGADRSVRVWRWPDGLLLQEMEGHTGSITALALAPSGPLAATYGADHVIRIWNYGTGRLIYTLDSLKDATVTALIFLENEQILVAGDDKGKIWFLNTSTGDILAPSPLDGHTQRITGLSMIPGQDRLASASTDGSVGIWPLQSFLWTHTPIALARPGRLQAVEKEMTHSHVTREEIQWLRLIQELLRWRQRFEVEIGEIQSISAGEFDIEL